MSSCSHDGDVVPVREWKRAVHAQHVELAPQEGLQVLRVQTHDLGDVVQATGCGVFFHEKVSTFIHCVGLDNFLLWNKGTWSSCQGLRYSDSFILPQHFPAVGTEQVVGGGRRAAAAPVHLGCKHRGRTAGRGWAVTAAARAVPGPDSSLATGRVSTSASSGRDVGMGGDGPRASGCPKRSQWRMPKRRRRRRRLLLTGPLFHPPSSSRPPPPPG